MPLTEVEFQNQVVDLAKRTGWLRYHTHDSRRSSKGFPDWVFVRERIIYAELKSEDGKVRPDQRVWLDALQAAGANVYLWRPGDLQTIATILSTRTDDALRRPGSQKGP